MCDWVQADAATQRGHTFGNCGCTWIRGHFYYHVFVVVLILQHTCFWFSSVMWNPEISTPSEKYEVHILATSWIIKSQHSMESLSCTAAELAASRFANRSAQFLITVEITRPNFPMRLSLIIIHRAFLRQPPQRQREYLELIRASSSSVSQPRRITRGTYVLLSCTHQSYSLQPLFESFLSLSLSENRLQPAD